MPRSLGTEGLNESLASSLKAALLVWLDFASGAVRLTNASSSMTWQGEHYVAVGSLGSVEAIAETSDLSASGVRMTLSGIDASLVAIALTESYQGRRGQVRLALLNDAMQVVDALILFDGKIDTMQITMGDTAQIVLTLEHRLIDAQRARTLCINEPMLKREHDLSCVAHRYLHRIDLAIKKYQGIDHLHRII